MSSPADVYDVIVIGAGFGGLGTALSLAERGARVCLLEALRYPGGCASTFTKNVRDAQGHVHACRFDAGATVVSGPRAPPALRALARAARAGGGDRAHRSPRHDARTGPRARRAARS
jgi:phytoene dehydrogenase-like protein